MTQNDRSGGVVERGIGKAVRLPLTKALEIAYKSMRVRIWRSFITMSGIILAVAFLAYMWSLRTFVDSLKGSDDRRVQVILEQQGYSFTDEQSEKEAHSRDNWLVVLALTVATVGITNAMLMSVTERFREIGTMKCLGALDSFVIKLFILESMFLGGAGALAGIIVGGLLSIVAGIWRFEAGNLFWYFPIGPFAAVIGGSVVLGMLLAVLGAIYPAWVAARMEPVVAMRVDV